MENNISKEELIARIQALYERLKQKKYSPLYDWEFDFEKLFGNIIYMEGFDDQ